MSHISPIHPGEILHEEFLKPLEISQYRLAKDIGVPPIRINEIVHGKRIITADTALRLSKYFQTTPEFWLNLQNHYDLEEQKRVLGKILKDVKICESPMISENELVKITASAKKEYKAGKTRKLASLKDLK